jgi:hypothetical protein
MNFTEVWEALDRITLEGAAAIRVVGGALPKLTERGVIGAEEFPLLRHLYDIVSLEKRGWTCRGIRSSAASRCPPAHEGSGGPTSPSPAVAAAAERFGYQAGQVRLRLYAGKFTAQAQGLHERR